MDRLKRLIVVSFISSIFLVGCKDDKEDNKNIETIVNSIPKLNLNFSKSSELNMMNALKELQDITIQNGGDRSVGSKGNEAAVKYIIDQVDKTVFSKTTTSFINNNGKIGKNIVVEIPGQVADSIVLIGAHYDSIKGSPGINDNASGVVVLLELLNQLNQAKISPKHTIRIAFWDSEEEGLDGAKDYAKNLSEAQLKTIKAYINVDMIGAHDPTAMIPDADKATMLKVLEQRLRDSAREIGHTDEIFIQSQLDEIRKIPTHPDDLALNKSLGDFFKTQNLKVENSLTVNERTDIAAFAGKVPVTGFVFKSNIPSEDEYIPCYHKPCDTIDKIDPRSLGISGNAVIHVLKTLKVL